MVSKSNFTLIEVLIASLILAITLAAVTDLAVSSQDQVIDGREQWYTEHYLSLGAEHYLLFGPNVEMDSDMLPEGYEVTCELRAAEFIAEEELAEKYFEGKNGWILGEYIITLEYNGEEKGQLLIKKLVQEDDVE